jgi:cell division septation protein DedD
MSPELTHDAEDGFHEIQLSGKQLVFLFMATTVVLVVTFLCGVLVGRGVQSEAGAEPPSEPVISEANTPPPIPAEPPPAGTEAPVDNPTYHTELQKPGPPTAELKPETKPAKPTTEPEPAPQELSRPEDPSSSAPTSGLPGTWFLQVTALKNRPAAAKMVETLRAKGYPAYLENPAAGAPPIYRVRVGRYKDRAEAERVARRLQKEEQFSSDIRR